MLKNHRQFVDASAKQTKHEQEMEILRTHHEHVLKDSALREAALVGAGVFVRTADGKIAVAKPYKEVITSKQAT